MSSTSGMRSTVEAGGADRDNARRSAPGYHDFPGDGASRARGDGLVLAAGRGR